MILEKASELIGRHILSQIDKFQREGKDFGQSLEIPFKMPARLSDEPDWTFVVSIQMPRFLKVTYDENNKPIYETITMAEYYGWKK